MPTRPPKLDDRKYADIVQEARTLIPQYCPEWTNLGDADPGMTLVQLFAWMTEMTIFRLNRVPDKTYVHFLNFIGEERRRARPATVPLTFGLRAEDKSAAEIPAFSRCVARPDGEGEALQFLTSEQVTVHGADVTRIVSVNAGPKPLVREIPYELHPEPDKGLLFNGGRGISLLDMDPIAHGPRSYTPQQYLYVAHDDFRLMDFEAEDDQALGRLRIRSATSDNLPVGALFKWEYFVGEDAEQPWVPIGTAEEEEEILGLPEIALDTHLPDLQPVAEFGDAEDPFPVPKDLQEEKYWIRGTVDYERWLAHRMQEDLEIAWRDDRGAEERPINNWEVRATGRNLEFFIQDMPPIRGGWTVQFTMVDRSMPAGKGQYLPSYRWLYRRRDQWEEIPADRVRHQDTTVILTGPLTEMATDGFNLRAERIETVHLRGFIPDLDLDVSWMRPVELYLGMGPETGAAVPLDTAELPTLPFQPANTLPPLLGMKFFIGSDLFENRAQKPVLVEIEVDFEWQDESIAEPDELYHMQLCYRAVDTWRVVYDRKGTYNQLTFKDLDEEGALKAGRRKVRMKLNPKTQLKDLHRAIIGGQETTWLRLELTKAQLTKRPDKKSAPLPITLKIYSVKLGVDGVMGKDVYEQPLPGPKMVMAEYRRHNRRLTRTVARVAGRLSEDYPFDTFIDVEDAAAKGGKDKKKDDENVIEPGHQAIYFQLNKPLPIGQRHAILFKCRGETFLPEGLDVSWELLEDAGRGRSTWARLTSTRDSDAGHAYTMNRSGTLAFTYPEAKKPSSDGHWMRVLFRMPREPQTPPALPPVSHMMLNTVEGVNLHAFRMERFSGLGVPHQSIQLRRYPIYLHGEDGEEEVFDRPERFPDLRVFVTEGDETRREWRKAPGNSILMASKDDRVFIVDPVDGTITFGNGIRGKMVPVGTYNIAVEVYHTVPGKAGNVSPGAVTACDGYADVVNVTNLLPATGGRNSESIEEIIRRAPSVLTSRDRAVTRLDFEIIAREASAEVARAACSGEMSGDGEVEVVVLPRRREGEVVPDPFLAAGLKDHVQQYLARRCLVNVRPVVRLATFRKVDVSLVLRLRANTNLLQVRDRAQSWIARFLDPYFGGLDAVGWPFGATLYAEDFGRMVSDIPEVRHIVDVQVYGIDDDDDKLVPGWEAGTGSRTLVLDERDLFQIRRIRVRAEGVE